MYENNVKTEIINNVMVAMAMYLEQSVMVVLEEAMKKQLVRVNMEEITTLPAESKNSVQQRNEDIIRLFMYKKSKLKPLTMRTYMEAVKRLIIQIDYKSLDQMDTMDLSYYLNIFAQREKDGKKIQASTYNNERRYLSAFYTWMRREKIIAENPVESIEAKNEIRKPIDYFRPEELAMLRDACRTPRERALLEVLRSTGARIGEVAEITLDQIDWQTGDILILGEKSDRYRTLYLDDDARHYYRLYLDSRPGNSQWMFPGTRKPYGRVSTESLRNVFKGVGERTGIKTRVYPHKMRKTLGMSLKNKGVDIGTISEIMGHAGSEVTSKYYAQSTPDTLRAVRKRAAGF